MIVGIAMLKVSKMHGANITIIKGMSAKACNTGHTCSVTVTQFGLGQVSMSTNRIARFVHVILPYVLEAWYPRTTTPRSQVFTSSGPWQWRRHTPLTTDNSLS